MYIMHMAVSDLKFSTVDASAVQQCRYSVVAQTRCCGATVFPGPVRRLGCRARCHADEGWLLRLWCPCVGGRGTRSCPRRSGADLLIVPPTVSASAPASRSLTCEMAGIRTDLHSRSRPPAASRSTIHIPTNTTYQRHLPTPPTYTSYLHSVLAPHTHTFYSHLIFTPPAMQLLSAHLLCTPSMHTSYAHLLQHLLSIPHIHTSCSTFYPYLICTPPAAPSIHTSYAHLLHATPVRHLYPHLCGHLLFTPRIHNSCPLLSTPRVSTTYPHLLSALLPGSITPDMQ